MAEEVGIVMSLYDRVSPTLKTIAGNTKAFDKNLDDLEESLKAYDKAQESMVKQSSELRKALAESSLKVQEAQKSYRKLKDETSKGALGAAIEEQTRLRRELEETDAAIKANSASYKILYKQAQAAGVEMSKADNRAGSLSSGGAGGILAGLGKAGIYDMAGDVASQLIGVFGESALGQPLATAVSSTLSGAASGAAIGTMVLPGLGTAIGAGVGGLLGAATGGSQIYEAKDDAFKSYVQEAAEGQLEEMDTILQSGSTTAGRREQDQIAFAQRFGSEEAAQDYLDQVRAMAVNTNYTYDEITGYSKSLLNTYGAEETLGVLQKLSDATAGLNLDSSGVSMFIAGLSRMRTTGKVTQEYLNYFSERGLDVYDALARGVGVDESAIADMVSSGEISGGAAAEAILDYIQEEFGGLSEKLASTYDAMVDNLEDAEANLNAKMGEAYNETRKEGIAAQQEWLENDELGEAYEAIGAWKASLENAKEQYIREAVDKAMESEDYQAAEAAGDAAEMGRIIMQAKVKGMGEYNENEGKDEVLAQEVALIDGIRQDTTLNEDYWNAGYTLGQEYAKGRLAGMLSDGSPDPPDSYTTTSPGGSRAFGMDRVPYDNYLAYLHEGERVLTASQAREMDRGGTGPSVTINVSGNTFGAGMDEEAVAEAIASAAARKLLAGFQG